MPTTVSLAHWTATACLALLATAPAAAQAAAALTITSHSGYFLDGNTRMMG